MDPITLSFLIGGGLMTGGGLLGSIFGGKGDYEQTGGLSAEAIRSLGDEQRGVGLKAIREEENRRMGQVSAGASMQGTGRSGLRNRGFSDVGRGGSDARAQLLASLAQQQAGLMASRQFSYVPSRTEQVSRAAMGIGTSFLGAGAKSAMYGSMMPKTPATPEWGESGGSPLPGMTAPGIPAMDNNASDADLERWIASL